MATASDPAQRLLEPVSDARWRARLAIAALVFLGLALSAYLGFRLAVFPIMPGGDPSSSWAVNYAVTHGFRFGRDIVYTLGPYGYLIEAVDVGNIAIRCAIGTSALVLLLGIAAALYVNRALPRRPVAQGSLLALLLYSAVAQSPDYRWFCLAVLMSLLGLHERGWTGVVARCAAGCLAGFLLLVKLSLGMGAVLTLLACAAIVRSRRAAAAQLAQALAATAAGLTAGWVAYEGTIGGLGAYLRVGLDTAEGYASACSAVGDRWWVAGLAIATFFALAAGWALALRTGRAKLTILGLAAPLLIAARHAMVRQDSHLRLFVMFGMFVIVILAIEAAPVWPVSRIIVACEVLLLFLLMVWFRPESAPEPGAGFTALRVQMGSPLAWELPRQLKAVMSLRSRRPEPDTLGALEGRRLPPALRQMIGGSTVDVYPWDLSYVPANNLTWANRPVPASFVAFTPALDAMDAAFFASPRRPRYLLWHASEAPLQSIDGRHLFWDEPRTLRTIFDRYELLTTSGDLLLLQATAEPRFAAAQPIGKGTVAWGDWIAVPPADGVVIAELRFHRSLPMALKRALFREGASYLTMRLASGREVTYRVVPDQMASGLWVSPLPLTAPDLECVLRGETMRRVVAIRVSSAPFGQLATQLEVSWLRLAPRVVPPPN